MIILTRDLSDTAILIIIRSLGAILVMLVKSSPATMRFGISEGRDVISWQSRNAPVYRNRLIQTLDIWRLMPLCVACEGRYL